MGEVMAFFMFFLYYLNLVLACLLNAIKIYVATKRCMYWTATILLIFDAWCIALHTLNRFFVLFL